MSQAVSFKPKQVTHWPVHVWVCLQTGNPETESWFPFASILSYQNGFPSQKTSGFPSPLKNLEPTGFPGGFPLGSRQTESACPQKATPKRGLPAKKQAWLPLEFGPLIETAPEIFGAPLRNPPTGPNKTGFASQTRLVSPPWGHNSPAPRNPRRGARKPSTCPRSSGTAAPRRSAPRSRARRARPPSAGPRFAEGRWDKLAEIAGE